MSAGSSLKDRNYLKQKRDAEAISRLFFNGRESHSDRWTQQKEREGESLSVTQSKELDNGSLATKTASCTFCSSSFSFSSSEEANLPSGSLAKLTPISEESLSDRSASVSSPCRKGGGPIQAPPGTVSG